MMHMSMAESYDDHIANAILPTSIGSRIAPGIMRTEGLRFLRGEAGPVHG